MINFLTKIYSLLFNSNKIKKIVSIPFALFFVLLLQLIQAFLIVRLAKISFPRLGSCYYIEWYLSEKKMGRYNNKYFDIFYEQRITYPNDFWINKWKEKILIIGFYNFFDVVLLVNSYFPNYRKFLIPKNHVYPDFKEWKVYKNKIFSIKKIYNKRLKYILKDKTPNINFTDNEKEYGESLLLNLGIPKDKQYICFHARDSEYLNSINPHEDWTYHNYRDSSIQNYIPAMEELVDRGYYGVRMGSIVKDEYFTNKKEIIDYSNSKIRTDFMDIYIGSNCKFFICSDCGISSIPEAFRVPCVYVNWVQIRRISNWTLNGVFIFKKIFSKQKNRFLNFSEIINTDIDSLEVRSEMDLELIENTNEEILEAAVEMEERINNTWKKSYEDEKYQNFFWSLFGENYLKSNNLRIGSKFLKKNINLLK